ncbi:MAG: sigma-70 family RNA polymerase sigma factor [Planctomycetota bacterium]
MNDSRELVNQASRGDAQAIDSLLDQHLPGVHAFVRLRMSPDLRGKESVSDLVQSACREVLQHMGRFQYQGEGNFKHFLYTTALRKVLNKHRYYHKEMRDVRREVDRAVRGSQSQDESLSQVYQTLSTPSGQIMRKEAIERLERAFDELPDDHREVVLLSRLMGLSHREIAAHMNRSEMATRSLLARALSTLAQKLAPGHG